MFHTHFQPLHHFWNPRDCYWMAVLLSLALQPSFLFVRVSRSELVENLNRYWFDSQASIAAAMQSIWSLLFIQQWFGDILFEQFAKQSYIYLLCLADNLRFAQYKKVYFWSFLSIQQWFDTNLLFLRRNLTN